MTDNDGSAVEIPFTEIDMEEMPFAFGGFGEVYKAKWQESNVAVKVFRVMNEKQKLPFMHEVNLIFFLNHPNIIDLFGVTNVSGWQLGIVMEMAEHGSLDCWIGKMERGQEIKIAMCVVNGLQYVHSQNVMHRDIKPKNILMCGPKDDMIPKIADFGSAKLIEKVTQNTKVGEIYYMAPEIAQRRQYGFQADIFSLAMTMFEMFNEQLIQESPEEVKNFVENVLRGQNAKIPKIRTVSLNLRNLIERGLNENPDTRPTLPEYLQGKNILYSFDENMPVNYCFSISLRRY